MVLMKAAIAKGFRIGLDGRSATEAQARHNALKADQKCKPKKALKK